jgi:hypothetical protein
MNPLVSPARFKPAARSGGSIEFGITQLVNGQAYIDVVLVTTLTDTVWDTVCSVVNTDDPTPLNIWPGVITAKSTTGFTVQLNGMPDSDNYFLHWTIIPGASAPVVVATTYIFSGPTSGNTGAASTAFTVHLPSGQTVPAPVTISPSDGGGGGAFTPATVNLTTAAPSATFTYTPASAGAKIIAVTNSGSLTDPSSITYTAATPVGPHLLNTLISYWKLDEASGARADSQGSNNLAANGAPAGVAGKINNGAQFVAASSQYLSIASNASLLVTSDFTFSLWVNLTAATVSFPFIKDQAGVGTDYWLLYSASKFTFGLVAVAGGPGVADTAATITTGTWYHLVCWYDSATGQVYVRVNDAATTQSTAAPALIQTPGAPFTIGGPGAYADAIVDEVGFWKRKLTGAEITALYNGGAGLPFSSFTA